MKEVFYFLNTLIINNNREWMIANKKMYDSSKKAVENFTSELISAIGQFDPDVSDLQAKDCLFRMNRDVRFSPNKSPYKENFGLAIQKGGKKSPFATYYLHLQPGDKSFVGGGIYMPMPDVLAKIRQEVDYNFQEFKNIVENREFEQAFKGLDGDKLSRPPKGYTIDNPAVEYLKYKNFVAVSKITDAEVLEKDFKQRVVKAFHTLYPLNQFLNRVITD